MLARRGAKVYLGARSESKATGAIAALEHEGLNGGQVAWLKIDLVDPHSVKAAAEEILAKEKRLDILVNNAALCMVPYEKSGHGKRYRDIWIRTNASCIGIIDVIMVK